MPPTLAALTEALLDAANRAGAEAADALAVAGSSLTVDLRQGRLEQAERAEGTEIGLRVLIGRRQACVSASDTSAATIAALAERAVAMAREAPDDPHCRAGRPVATGAQTPTPPRWTCATRRPSRTAAALEAAARAAEAAALAASGVSQVEPRPAGRGARCTLRRPTGFTAAMHGRRTRCRPSPFAAPAREWSATGPARRAAMPPTCPMRPGSARWRPNVHWRGWARSSRRPAISRCFTTNGSPPR